METLKFRWDGPYSVDEARTLREEVDYGLYAKSRLNASPEIPALIDNALDFVGFLCPKSSNSVLLRSINCPQNYNL